MLFGSHSSYRQNLESLSVAAKVMTDFYRALEQRSTRINCRAFYSKALFQFTLLQSEIDTLFDQHTASVFLPFIRENSADYSVEQRDTLSDTIIEISHTTSKILRLYKADWLEEFADELAYIHEHVQYALDKTYDSGAGSEYLCDDFAALRDRLSLVTEKLSSSLYSTMHLQATAVA